MPLFCWPLRTRSTKFCIISLLISLQFIFDLILCAFLVKNSNVTSSASLMNKALKRSGNYSNNPPFENMKERGQKATTFTVKPPAIDVPLTKPSTTGKAKIDMVNDYHPWIDFKFVYPYVQPDIEGPRDNYLIVLVNSGANGDTFRQRRRRIRETWASRTTCEFQRAMKNDKINSLKWILVFVLGKAGEQEDKRNREEARVHNDMIIGDIDDNYLNNILKFYMGQLWASMQGAKYTLKTDDDVYVRVPKIIEYLVTKGSPSRFYGGETYLNSAVMHWPGGKWSISRKYFNEDVFPPFNAGAFILMSTDLLGSLMNYVHIRKPFHTDDAYIGVAMRDFKVKVVHILSFDIKNRMGDVLKTKNNCGILKLIAYGHEITPDSMVYLHGRVERICHENITLKTCLLRE